MGIDTFPPELVQDILARVTPRSLKWKESRDEVQWFLALRRVCRRFDSAVMLQFLATIKKHSFCQDFPLARGVPTPSMVGMCRQLLAIQVNLDHSRESEYALINVIRRGADAAVDMFRDHDSDVDLLRERCIGALISSAIGFRRTRPLLEHLASKDNVQKLCSVSDEDCLKAVLVAAAALGRISDMERLIDSGAGGVNCVNVDTWLGSPYQAAAIGGHLDALQLLADHGAKDNVVDDRNTALHRAAIAGQDSVVTYLLDSGIDCNLKNKAEETPLVCATAAGHASTIRLLLHNGADPNIPDAQGKTPLMWAAWRGRGHENAMKVLLDSEVLDVNKINPEAANITALAYAAVACQEEAVKLLLSHPKTDAHAKDFRNEGILRYAVVGGSAAIVERILELPGMDVNAQSGDGSTALIWAAHKGFAHIVRLLLSQPGIQVNLEMEQGATALTLALAGGKMSVVRALLECDGLNVKSSNGYSLLGEAAVKGDEELVQLLLARRDIDPTEQDIYGRAPLSRAALHGHSSIVKMLLCCSDMEVNLIDSSQSTALMYASERGHGDVVRILLDVPGIQVWCENEVGETALLIAAYGGHSRVVELLLTQDVGCTSDAIRRALAEAEAQKHEDVRVQLVNKLASFTAQ